MQFGALARLGEKIIQLFLHDAAAAAAAVLHVELEAAGRAHAGDRRWIDRQHEPVAQLRECRVEARQGGEREQGGILAFVERFHRDELDRRVVLLLAVDQVVAVDRRNILHGRIGKQDLFRFHGELAGHRLAGGIGHGHRDEEIALILVRHEAGRQYAEEGQHGGNHRTERDEALDRVGNDAADTADIALAHTFEGRLEPLEEALLLAVVRLEDDRRERRRKRQRHDPGDDHRDRDGDRELLVERARDATEEGHWQEDGEQHQHDRDQRAGDFRHRRLGSLEGRELLRRHVGLDRLDDDDRIVHDEADGEDHAEHRQHVDREAEQVHADEGTDDGNRDREDRDHRRPQRLQEDEDDEHDEDDGLEEGVDDLLDRVDRKQAGVEHDLVFESGRKGPLQFIEAGAHRLRRIDGVGTGLLVDGDGGAKLAVDAAGDRVVALGHLDRADVLQADDRRALLGGTNDDVLEFLGLREQALRRHDEGLVDTAAHRRRADLADAEGLVLALDGIADLLRRHPQLGHAVGAQPDAHGDVRQAEDAGPVSARNALQFLKNAEVGEVVEEGCVVAVVLREDRDHEQEARRLAVDGHSLLRHYLRQLRQRLADTVLHVDLVDVRVAARLEEDVDRQVAGGRARRLEVKQVVDAVDLRLQGRRDGIGDDFRGGTRVACRDLDLRRRHVRILLDRRDRQRDGAGEHDQERDDRREDRPGNEEVGKHGAPLFLSSAHFAAVAVADTAAAAAGFAAGAVSGVGFTGAFGTTRTRPSTITRSPDLSPCSTTISLSLT